MRDEIVLGIDPGLGTTGWGIVSLRGDKISYIDCGKVSTSPSQEITFRIGKLFRELQDITKKYRVTCGAVESGFIGKSVQSALKLGQARSAVVLALVTLDIPVIEFSPREVKLALTGSGSSAKEQVGYMVGKMLKLAFDSGEQDISDALAVAICRATHNQRLSVLRAL